MAKWRQDTPRKCLFPLTIRLLAFILLSFPLAGTLWAAAFRPPKKGEILIIKHISLLLALAVLALCCLAACGSAEQPSPSSVVDSGPPAPPPAPTAWWETLDWDNPGRTLAGEGLTVRLYENGRAGFTLELPEGTLDSLAVYTREGQVDTLAPADGVWAGANELEAREENGTLTLLLRDESWDTDALTALKAAVTKEGQTEETFYRLEEDETFTAHGPSLPDFSQQTPQFRYLLRDTGEDRVVLTLYWNDSFLLSRRADGGEEPMLWGEWEDGNTAITFWPDEQCCGPDTRFRLEKTGGLRVYNGGGAPSLPIAVGDAFQRVGDILDLPAFDAAVVSLVVEGDRPAIFLDRAEDEELLEEFRAMMADAAELRNPQWTEDPEDRPNLQFDLNLNGEDITMVLCPCIVAGTEDKYLLVQKDSYMGRVTYTYYQTQQGDDYDRMVALFDRQYEAEPQTLTAAMAAQIRAQTAAISNLDWSDQFPLDENGIPIGYKAVLREQRATGYWRSGNVYGAGSRACQAKTGVYYCTAGTVAVRSDEIPYGTKLYIRTQGGGFIYGYAVANDTGTGLVEGLIDIDLFYDSYEESKLNSVRWVDVYILE